MSKQFGDKLGDTVGGEDKCGRGEDTCLRTNGVPNLRFALGDALTLQYCAVSKNVLYYGTEGIGHNISFVCPNLNHYRYFNALHY